jgi:hypothetical protein
MKSYKNVIAPIVYNLSVVIIFALIYSLPSVEFKEDTPITSFLDYIGLSITIQTGVGLTSLHPIDSLSKFIVILQQMLLLFGNLIIFVAILA